jgi:hypothetical protein
MAITAHTATQTNKYEIEHSNAWCPGLLHVLRIFEQTRGLDIYTKSILAGVSWEQCEFSESLQPCSCRTAWKSKVNPSW